MNDRTDVSAPTDDEHDVEAVWSMTASRPDGHGPDRVVDWLGHHAANRPGIVEELLRNATGKVLERELRDRFVGADVPSIS